MKNTGHVRRPRVRLIAALLVTASAALVSGACAPKEEPPPRSAEQQRAADSTIGASRLPGAGGVKNAMAVSDSAARRKAELDSIARNP